MASAAAARREESFQRCDTEGFISQWADGLTSSLYQQRAEIARNGGMAEFPALYDLGGNRVPAKVIDTRFGSCWALIDPDTGRFTGSFLQLARMEQVDIERHDEKGSWTDCILRQTKRSVNALRRKGYFQATEMAPARAEIRGKGYGLSGRAWVAVERTDRGWIEGGKYQKTEAN